MSIAATYVSATSFTASSDLTTQFTPGRAIRADCGVDGIKYAYVSYSSYAAPTTTVTLESTDSQAITSNLSAVLFSRIQAKEAGGNVPLQEVWMNRGFKSGMTLTWKDADEIYVDSGALHIDNGTAENIYCAQSQLTKQLTSLSASTWYAIYVDPPDNGLSLVAADIEYSTTMPTYDQAKRGWYHGTNTDWRCIGFIFSDGSSNIKPFQIFGSEWRCTDKSIATDISNKAPSNTFTTYTFSVPAGATAVVGRLTVTYGNAGANLLYRYVGSSAAGVEIEYITNTKARADWHLTLPIDSSKQVQLAWGGATTNAIYYETIGFHLPKGM